MGRTEKIASRIRRNLSNATPQEVLLDEIYDEMQSAQIDIMTRTKCMEKEITVTTVEDQAEYDLDSNVMFIKHIIIPSTYTSKVDIVDNQAWNDIVNSNYSGSQPLYITVFARQAIFNPAPSNAGETIKLWCVLQEPDTIIANSVEPEIASIFDNAIEYFATAKLSGNPDWLLKYESELSNKSFIPGIKHTTGKQLPSRW